MTEFATCGVLTRSNDTSVADTLTDLTRILAARGIRMLAHESTRALLPDDTPTVDSHTLGKESDVVAVIGGDGTLLNAARALSPHGVPVIGINRGRLGFLVDVSPQEHLHQLEQILEGDYSEEQRQLLRCEVHRADRVVFESNALNDIVLRNAGEMRLVDFEIHIDGCFVNYQHADGVIVSTPTGSTAYALSNGGPIMYPMLEAISVVSISPHTLSARPLMLSSSSEIYLLLRNKMGAKAQLTCDGHNSFDLLREDQIQIYTQDERLRLLHPPGYDFFQILRTKLKWG